ncbi:MAG: hypothetical protein ACOY9Y_08335 [Bacillota bacterium]
MRKIDYPLLTLGAGVSAAVAAVNNGQLVVVVDVIDMSTTLECALEDGAIEVFGASPNGFRSPFELNPNKMGELVGKTALHHKTEVILVAEPRLGPEEERINSAKDVLEGIYSVGATVKKIIPNLGKETLQLTEFYGSVVIAVTNSGGVVWDAVVNAGGLALPGTVARTKKKKGVTPGLTAAERAICMAKQTGKGIAVIAASANALEDILAAQYIFQYIFQKDFW